MPSTAALRSRDDRGGRIDGRRAATYLSRPIYSGGTLLAGVFDYALAQLLIEWVLFRFGLRSEVADGVGVEGVADVEGELAQRPGACFDSVEPLVVECP